MKRKLLYKILIFAWCAHLSIYAQDHVHFTQYNWVPSFQNPAAGGQMKTGDMAYGIIYRDQAFTVTDNEFKSFAAHVDSRFNVWNKAFGMSLSIVNDIAGDGGLKSNLIGLGLSHEIAFGQKKKQFVALGLQGQLIQRKFNDLSAFIFEQELVNGINTEPIINEQTSYGDLNAGITYRNEINKRSALFSGFSVHHLNNSLPANTEINVDKYALKYNFFVEYRLRMNEAIWLQPKIQHLQSEIYRATQLQTMLEYTMSSHSDYTLLLGMGWRVRDALEFLLGVRYKSWEVGIAYDYNTSGLRAASGSVAGLEIGIRYSHWKPVKEETLIAEEIPVLPEKEIPEEVHLIIRPPDDIPVDSLRITIFEDGHEPVDTVITIWPMEYRLNPERHYEFVIDDPAFIRDSISFTPELMKGQPQIERKLQLEIKPAELPEPAPEIEPEIPEEEVIYIEEAIVLDHIYYDFDKDNIIEASESEMLPLLEIMLAHPDMVIELSSHTDVRGSDEYNIDLSQRRANSAKSWLVERGIDAGRIVAKGYGESQLINHCENGVPCSEILHRKNRRTEFKIIAGPKSVRYRQIQKN